MTRNIGGIAEKCGEQKQVAPALIRYCLYARKSTEEDEKQALSIDSQIKEMLALAEKEKLVIIEMRKESHSAKASGQRPVYNQLLVDIRAGMFNGILTWMPDRLSRNAGDLGALVDLMDEKLLIEVRTYGQKFTNTPSKKFLLMIMGSQAKLENDNKSLNVKRGLRTRVESGLWPGVAPIGYLNGKNKDQSCQVFVDPVRASTVKKIFEKVGHEKWSGRQLFAWLKDELKFTSKNGKFLALSNIYLTLRNSFYCGIFEYPRESGNWYEGKHTPLISRDLYDAVQEQLSRDAVSKTYNKEFTFTKLIKCGSCGSGITADEKFKKLKDGGTNRYVYYGCTRAKDHNCKGGYLREEELVRQLLLLMDKLSLDKIGMRFKIEKELERHREFREDVLGVKNTEEPVKEIDIRNYAKHILRKGSMFEKRELLTCLKSKLLVKNKTIYLEE